MNRISAALMVSFVIAMGMANTGIFAQVPSLINYQGRLTDIDGQPMDGKYSITFRLYESKEAGTYIWEEPHQGVEVQEGIFNVVLGSVMPFNLPFDKEYFLELIVEGDTMAPRQRMTSAGYAMRAKVADEAESLPQEVILMCKDSCPAGYRRIGALDGKFLAGGTSYNTSAGGSNTHSHTLSEANIPAHTHSSGSLAIGNESSHNHQETWASGSGYILAIYGASGSSTPEMVRAETGTMAVSYPLLTAAGSAHTHTVSGSTGSIGSTTAFTGDNRPEFATVVLCEKE